jgi:uncharacterized protein YjeT (DUF2065 family)
MTTQTCAGLLPFAISRALPRAGVTAHAGLSLILEGLRALFPRRQWRLLARALKIRSWRVVRRHCESLVLLIAAGGDCLDDLTILRRDCGLSQLLGLTISSPTQAKKFLYAFHQAPDGTLLTDADDARLSQVGQARIRAEGPGLRVLEAMLHEVVRLDQARRPLTLATLDVDATIIEACKKLALKAYEGTIGYQPQMAWWAEKSLWLCDEFRDGNVPAAFDARRYLQRAFAALPASVTTRRLRADSAFYDQDALTWAADEASVEFVVSADMSKELTAAVKKVPEAQWRPYRSDDDDPREERQWAEVPDFVPDWKRNRKKDGLALRYLAIRVRSRQSDLLVLEAETWRHFAVVTNLSGDGERLLRWHRQKAGTVEQGHRIMKDGLAGGTLPCGRFGANAAWWRLNVLLHNLLTLLKTEVLPTGFAKLQPKALRFRLFNLPGVLVRHARKLVLAIAAPDAIVEVLIAARRALLALAAWLRPKAQPG